MKTQKLTLATILMASTIVLGGCSATALNSVGSLAMGGGSGGGSYTQVATNFLTVKGELVSTLQEQTLIKADIMEALDLQSEAEALRAEAKSIEEKGDAIGSDDLEVVKTLSEAADSKVQEKYTASESLTDKQKEALGVAAKRYLPTVIQSVVSAKKLKDIVQQVVTLGAPAPSDVMSLGTNIRAIKEAPTVGADLVQVIYNSAVFGKDMIVALDTNDIAEVDSSALKDVDFSDF
jgi:hypothetical protein